MRIGNGQPPTSAARTCACDQRCNFTINTRHLFSTHYPIQVPQKKITRVTILRYPSMPLMNMCIGTREPESNNERICCACRRAQTLVFPCRGTNRHGHWVCWTSIGGKHTHTHAHQLVHTSCYTHTGKVNNTTYERRLGSVTSDESSSRQTTRSTQHAARR